jgi:hypothetical protein
MKLELKHILPYLDSGLKAVDNQGEPDDNIINITGFSNTNGEIEFFDQYGNFDIKLSDIKPILRPLSDLTKEIEINGEKFVPIEKVQDWNTSIDFAKEFEALLEDERWLSTTSYLLVELLFEWHFDVFGLIEKGLAIDFNETFTQK